VGLLDWNVMALNRRVFRIAHRMLNRAALHFWARSVAAIVRSVSMNLAIFEQAHYQPELLWRSTALRETSN
jgi:hypothetical protein